MVESSLEKPASYLQICLGLERLACTELNEFGPSDHVNFGNCPGPVSSTSISHYRGTYFLRTEGVWPTVNSSRGFKEFHQRVHTLV